MPKLTIPVGIPGCGKSTFARVIGHTNMRFVSSDDIRADMVKEGKLKDVGDMSANKEVFVRYYERIEDHLLDGFDVYADATNLRDFARTTLREIATRTGAETHVLVFTNLSDAVSRNMKRERVVNAEAMVSMLQQFEKMQADILRETYTTVTYIGATT